MTNYAAGWNMGGYSPDPEHVWITEDHGSAVDYLLETLERWQGEDGDSWDDGEDRCSWDERLDEYISAVGEVERLRMAGDEVVVRLADRNGYDWFLWVQGTDEPVDSE